MDIVELDLGIPQTIRKFEDFYHSVFSKYFPPDEIGSMQSYLELKESEKYSCGAFEYHMTFMEEAGKYIGCFIYSWFPKIQSIAAEFACIDERYRGRSISKMLMKHAESQHHFKWMFGEVESANTTNRAIWSKYGFKLVPIQYKQLSLGAGCQPIDDLALCVYCHIDGSSIPIADVRDFVWHYYRYSQFCTDPDGTDVIQAIDRMLNGAKMLRLLQLYA